MECILTNDVETTSIWKNKLSDSTGLKVQNEGLPLLLDIYEQYNIKSTFYFTGYYAKLFPSSVKLVHSRGHEIASHGYSHANDDSFDVIDFKTQKRNLEKSKYILEDIIGDEIISFRAPALRISHNTHRALHETGFKTDSSVVSQRFDFFFSYGSKNKLNWLFAPRKPYFSDINNPFKISTGPIFEIPLTSTLLPFISTTMRIFPRLTRIQTRILILEAINFIKPIVFDIHPNEFIDESSKDLRKINRRSSNYLGYLVKDYFRSKLKVKNI